MEKSERPTHTLEVDGQIEVRKGGEWNIGDGADTNTKAKGLNIAGLMNTSSINLKYGFLTTVVAGVIVGFILWFFGLN